MIDKICDKLVEKMKKQLPDVDDEKAEILKYGLQLLIGELPKIFLVILISFLLGIGELTLLTFLMLLPYRVFSGGIHMKTHIGCFLGTTLFYCGNVLLSKNIVIDSITIKCLLIGSAWIFGIIMCKLYAPADTENVPILSKKERKKKRILSYISLTIMMICAVLINNNTISNILIFGSILQSILITKIAYKVTKNKYGYEVYAE